MSEEYHLPLRFCRILFTLVLLAQSTEGTCNQLVSFLFYDRIFCYQIVNWFFNSLSNWPSTDRQKFGGGAQSCPNMQETTTQNNFIHFTLGLSIVFASLIMK